MIGAAATTKIMPADDDRLTGKQAYADLIDALAKYNEIASQVDDAPEFKLAIK